MLSLQQAFDKVWQHFVVEKGKPSVKRHAAYPECQYRSENGDRCAIGVLIPDELYDTDLEGQSAYGLMQNYSRIAALFDSNVDAGDLEALQGVHDKATEDDDDETFTDRVTAGLRDYARKRGLVVPS